MKKISVLMCAGVMASMMVFSSFAGVVGHGVDTVLQSSGQTADAVAKSSAGFVSADVSGAWAKDSHGWWWRNPDGTWPKNSWNWLDGNRDGISECYYFGPDGYMLSGTVAPDGYIVNDNGAWVLGDRVQIKMNGADSYTAKTKVIYTYDGAVNEEESNDTAFSKEAYIEKVVELVNKEREKRGKNALSVDDTLMDVADTRAEEIVSKFAHTRPDGTSCFTAFDEAGIDDSIKAGENIARGQTSPGEVMENWMNSSGHRANILEDEFNYIGVSVVKSSGTYYWVQDFTA